MKQIEELMPRLFVLMPPEPPSPNAFGSVSDECGNSIEPESIIVSSAPLATIDEVLPDSPAHTAGLMDGDILLAFGSVTAEAENPFAAIPSIVRNYVDRELSIRIARHSDLLDLIIVPRIWGGRGLLGCHLSPIK